jgi:LAS superfamily LD-carboxypeptidase LdcB
MTMIGSFSGILEADIERATWPESTKERPRDHAYRLATLILARLLLPFAALVSPRHARQRASEWALPLRFPKEKLAGLTEDTRHALIEARTVAFWRYGELIGVTSGKRNEAAQQRMFNAAVERYGSVRAAQRWVLPPHKSAHVRGTAMDLRPYGGARWLDKHGERFGLYRTFDNEWWHFEYLDDVAYESIAS